jgi:transcriptional regulator with XRE-family HTH domain
MPGRWDDLKKKHMSPERIEKASRAAAATALDMDLRALREAAGLTQVQMAPLLQMTQSELSRFERREDHRMTMIRRFVTALGGTMKIVVQVRNKSITLADSDPPARHRPRTATRPRRAAVAKGGAAAPVKLSRGPARRT